MVEVLTYISLCAAAAAAIWSFWVKILRPFWNFIKRVALLIDSIENIMCELRPNGGASLRDAINRIEAGLILEQNARRAAAMVMSVGLWESDGVGNCLWANKKYLEMAGLLPEQARGFGWINGIHIDERNKVLTEWTKALEQKRIFSMLVRFERQRSIVYAVPALNNSGELLGYVGTSTPVEG
jgi:PAS domain S-box-containing protein